MRGFTSYDINDIIIKNTLRGASNLDKTYAIHKSSTRRCMTLPLLQILGHNLASSGWSLSSIQTVWTACLLAFFGSMRMGELLAPTEHSFDPSSTMTWSSLKWRTDGSILLHIKIPKTHTKEGDYVDIFPFPQEDCCPVAAVKFLKSLQINSGIYDNNMPIFRVDNGKFLTVCSLNSCLKFLMKDVCDEKNKISSHSFRAAIPSVIGQSPIMSTSSEIKTWGRWKSTAFQHYTRLKLAKKKNIHKKIVEALL
jgi:hypothetical protein